MTSYLIEILLPTTAGDGQPVHQDHFEQLLRELTDRFGGATSFVRLPGHGLWETGGNVETENIAVIEVMTDDLDELFIELLGPAGECADHLVHGVHYERWRSRS